MPLLLPPSQETGRIYSFLTSLLFTHPNPTGLQSFVDAATQDNFNFDAWDRWVNTLSASKNTKVFLGVPASTGAAKSGYKSAEDLVRVIDYAKGYKTFGGVMIWDVTLAYANGGYVTEVKSKL